MQSSLTEPMLSTTGNASSTQRLLEGQTDAAATAKALIKPDAWVQAGKTLFQRATGGLPLYMSPCKPAFELMHIDTSNALEISQPMLALQAAM